MQKKDTKLLCLSMKSATPASTLKRIKNSDLWIPNTVLFGAR